jgi:hypothetical protein
MIKLRTNGAMVRFGSSVAQLMRIIKVDRLFGSGKLRLGAVSVLSAQPVKFCGLRNRP